MNIRKTLSFLLLVALLVNSLGFIACPQKSNGDKLKPSEMLTAARSFAVFPVVLDGIAQALDLFRAEQDMGDPTFRKSVQLLDGVESALDKIREQIASGAWDVEGVRNQINQIVTTLKEAVNDGTLHIKNPAKQLLFASLLDYAQTILFNIYQIADTMQPAPATIANARQQESITIGGVAALSSLIAVKYAEVRQLTAMTDIKALYAKARATAQALHEANLKRLASPIRISFTPRLLDDSKTSSSTQLSPLKSMSTQSTLTWPRQ